jgi:23S rRNA (uracil1939-C5)-methyltransferase
MRLSGRSHVRETVAGMSFLVSPTAFFQTNVEAAETLVRIVLGETASLPPSHVLDLYAGSGLFSLPIASQGHRVVSVEENTQAVRDADANLRLNRLSGARVRWIASRVEDALKTQSDEVALAVLDPPRQGCPPNVLRSLFGQLRPDRVIYVSCNPEALASELPAILDLGYAIDRVRPVDMFPHTTHIETVVSLRRVLDKPRVPKVPKARR